MSITVSARALLLRVTLLLGFILPGSAGADPQARYEVVNQADIALQFATMDPARGTWKNQVIEPGQRRSFIWASGADQGRVRIGTEGRGYVEYDVHTNKRYSIVWDGRKGMWDFRTTGTLGGRPQHAGAGGYQAQGAWNSGNGAPGQYAPTQVGTGQPRPSWTLFNRSNERLEFQTLDYTRGTWRDQVTHPHQQTSYSFGPGQSAGKVRIATTNRGYVEYDVHAGQSYTIIWDKRKGMWDFRRARNDG